MPEGWTPGPDHPRGLSGVKGYRQSKDLYPPEHPYYNMNYVEEYYAIYHPDIEIGSVKITGIQLRSIMHKRKVYDRSRAATSILFDVTFEHKKTFVELPQIAHDLYEYLESVDL